MQGNYRIDRELFQLKEAMLIRFKVRSRLKRLHEINKVRKITYKKR